MYSNITTHTFTQWSHSANCMSYAFRSFRVCNISKLNLIPSIPM